MAGVGGGNTSSATEKRFLFFPVTLPTKVQSIMSQVDQYHEEAGGQRTVVRLGEFQR